MGDSYVNGTLSNLPIYDLVSQPLIACTQAQGQLAGMSADFITNIGLQRETYYRVKTGYNDSNLTEGNGPYNKADVIGHLTTYREGDGNENKTYSSYLAENFEEVPVADAPVSYEVINVKFAADTGTDDGRVEVTAPLLSIVPIPTLQIKEVDVNFKIELNTSERVRNQVNTAWSFSGSGGWPFFKFRFSGNVNTSHTRENNTSSKSNYDFHVHAGQVDTPGLTKLLDIIGDYVVSKNGNQQSSAPPATAP
jgi:hypothetical protein